MIFKIMVLKKLKYKLKKPIKQIFIGKNTHNFLKVLIFYIIDV